MTKRKDEILAAANRSVRVNLDAGTVKVLEAGCGSLSHIDFPMSKHITGIDISREQLERNEDIDVKILGDIQDPQYFQDDFDLIVCWDVLEHVDTPDTAVENFVNALADNGVLVIKVPNLLSSKGLITKLTPHWFHVFVYKYILGKRDAGEPGRAPFPTTLRSTIAPPRLKSSLRERGLEEIYSAEFDALPRNVLERPGLRFVYYLSADLLRLITFGRYGGRDNTDFVCIFKKAVDDAPRPSETVR